MNKGWHIGGTLPFYLKRSTFANPLKKYRVALWGTSPKKTIALLPQILIVYKRDIHIR